MKETVIMRVIDSLTTYVVALFTLLFASILAHAYAIMTIGGLILLLLRLYVDGSKAWKTWKGDSDVKRGS